MGRFGFSRRATLFLSLIGGLILISAVALAAVAIINRTPSAAPAPTAAVRWTGLPSASVTRPQWQSASSTNHINDLERIDRLLWAATDGGVVVWDLDSGESTLFTVEHGLPGNRINAITAAPNGNIWVAAAGGIARHDGSGWQTFEAEGGPFSAEVHDVLALPDGTIWAATDEGLFSTTDGRSWRAITRSSLLSGLPSNTVTALAAAQGNDIWVGTDSGIARTDGRNWELFDATTGLSSNEISALAATPDGSVWAATPTGLNQFNGRSWRSILLPAPYAGLGIATLAAQPDGTVWLGFDDLAAGLIQFDGSSIVNTLTATSGLPADAVSAVHLSNTGELWAATPSAVTHIDRLTVQQTLTPPTTLPANDIHDLLLAPSGLWAATDGGVAQFDGTWHTFTSAEGLIDSQPTMLGLGPDGGVWVGHANPLLGLSAQQPGGGFAAIACQLTTPPSSQITDGIAAPDGSTWFATDNGLARVADEVWTHFTALDGLPSNTLSAVAVTPNGTVWVGSAAGLARVDGNRVTPVSSTPVAALTSAESDTLFVLTTDNQLVQVSAEGQISPLPDLPANVSVRALHSGPEGTSATDGDTLWLATDAGAARLVGQQWQFFGTSDGLDGESTTALGRGADGTLWIATNNDQRLDLRWFDGTRFQIHPARDPAAERLSNIQVKQVLPTANGEVWFATADGVDRYANGQWERFTREDGLPSNEVHALVYAQDTVWALTPIGMAYFIDRPGAYGFVPFGGAHGQGLNELQSITVAPDDALWFTTEGFHDGLRVFDGFAWRIVSTMANFSTLRTATFDAQGRYWVAGDNLDRGVPFFGFYDPATNTWTWDVVSHATPAINTLAFAPDGLLWVGLADGNGIEVLDVTGGDVDTVVARFEEPAVVDKITFAPDGSALVGSGNQLFTWDGSSWSHESVPQPFLDEMWDLVSIGDEVWISSAQGVVHRLTNGEWETITAPILTPGWWGSISEMVVRPDGGIAVGTSAGGVGLYTGRSYLVGRPDLWRGQTMPVTMLANEEDGTLWVGTNGLGLAILEGENWRTLAPAVATTAEMTSLGFTPDGTAWMGTEVGLLSAVIDNDSLCHIALHDENLAATEVLRTRDGALWFGSTNGGAVEITGRNSQPQALWPESPVSLITQAPDGSLWAVNTRQEWLNYRSAESDTWSRVPLRQDLLTAADITSMAVDNQRTVWLGTNRGVFVFNGREWSHLTAADGLPDNQIDAIQVTPDGAVWFATPAGLGRYLGR